MMEQRKAGERAMLEFDGPVLLVGGGALIRRSLSAMEPPCRWWRRIAVLMLPVLQGLNLLP